MWEWAPVNGVALAFFRDTIPHAQRWHQYECNHRWWLLRYAGNYSEKKMMMADVAGALAKPQ